MSKKDEETIAEQRRRCAQVMAQINKKAKHNVIAYASEVPNAYVLRYPTGCMSLDIDLGGGFPASGMSILSGPDGAGKTALIYLTMAMNQRIRGERSSLALAAVEFLPDYFFMRYCGVQVAIPDEMIEQQQEIREERGVPLFTKEEIKEFKRQVGDFCVIRGATGEEMLDAVLTCFASKSFDIVGLDSINSFMSQAEAETDGIGDTIRQATKAAPLSRFCDRFHPLTLGMDGPNQTLLLATGQVRANRERMYANMKAYVEVMPWAIKHAALIRVLLWKSNKVKATSGENKGDVISSNMVWEITKGKAGTHDGIRGETEFTYEKLLDNYSTVVQAGMKYGVLKETKGIFSIIRPEDGAILVEKIPGVTQLVEAMKNDVQFELSLRREILAAAGHVCTYT